MQDVIKQLTAELAVRSPEGLTWDANVRPYFTGNSAEALRLARELDAETETAYQASRDPLERARLYRLAFGAAYVVTVVKGSAR